MTEKEMSKTTEEEEIKENPQPKKSLWGGIGSFLSSVKEKTLKLVDDLQDQITALDESIGKSEEKEQKLTFDPSLLPIIESATTYLEEPTNPEFKTFSESFNIEEKQNYIQLFEDNCPNLRRIHTRLVPSLFEEKVFWSRLFFKLQLREDAQRVSKELEDSIIKEDDTEKLDESIELSKEELEELENIEIGSDEDWGDWK